MVSPPLPITNPTISFGTGIYQTHKIIDRHYNYTQLTNAKKHDKTPIYRAMNSKQTDGWIDGSRKHRKESQTKLYH